MMDHQEDRLDALILNAARDYNAPPPAPKAEMWERIVARRSDRSPPVRLWSRPTVRLALGIAALLLVGIAIGRLTAPGRHAGGATEAAPSGSAAAPAAREEPRAMASRLATAQHFSQAETFLTEFSTRPAPQDFTQQAQNLLGTTRLLLDSKQLTDVSTRKLLEDLELVLVQIATLDPTDRREDLGSIADGLAQSHLRTRLRNAVPAGPIIRM